MRDIDLSYLGKSRPLECGDFVEKTSGYVFRGIIVSIFETTQGNVRYVVEADHPDSQGMLHIFDESQLKRR